MNKHRTSDLVARIRQPQIILITGTMAAGKSSVAQALAEQFPRSVHLRGDLFRRMIVSGQAAMTPHLSTEAYGQLRLRYQIAVTAAKLYLQAGFTVIHQDIIIGPDLAEVVQTYGGNELSVVVLCPSAQVVAAREAARPKTGYPNEAAVYEFDHMVRTETPRIGYWLDTSSMTIAETVEQILIHLSQATPTD